MPEGELWRVDAQVDRVDRLDRLHAGHGRREAVCGTGQEDAVVHRTVAEKGPATVGGVDPGVGSVHLPVDGVGVGQVHAWVTVIGVRRVVGVGVRPFRIIVLTAPTVTID